MDESLDKALDDALYAQSMYDKGWEDAKQYYRESFHMMHLEFSYQGVMELTYEMINDIFNEVPEDMMDLLYRAGLNRGQP